jgi:uncharacterized protein YdaU (DUF1376 family)
MVEKTDAWMPLWIGAYLADTMRLTTIQHGAYLLLMMAYWRERKALPDDDNELRAITKTEKSEWKLMRPVLSKFFRVDGGVWWHKRVEREMALADERSKKSSDKAAKAAQARWGNQNPDNSSNAPSMLQALPKDVLNECPTPSPIEDIEAKASTSESGIPDCPHEDLIDLYAKHLPSLAQPRKSLWRNGKNAPALRARWRWVMTATHEKGERTGTRIATTRDEGLAWFEKFFLFVSQSDFLMGSAGSWACDLGWLANAANFEKVLQGNYDNNKGKT